MVIKKLKERYTKSQSRNKIASMMELYEQYIDEEIDTIKIFSSTYYLINDKWTVDITKNTVSRSYPDPD
jgi:hypothetical protein